MTSSETRAQLEKCVYMLGICFMLDLYICQKPFPAIVFPPTHRELLWGIFLMFHRSSPKIAVSSIGKVG